MKPNIAIIAVHDNKTTNNATWELLAMAQKLPNGTNENICVVFTGNNITGLASDFSKDSGCPAIAVNTADKGQLHSQKLHACLKEAFSSLPGLEYVLAMHNSTGMDAAPGLSVLLNGSCITSVEEIRKEEKQAVFVRSMFSGKIKAEYTTDTFPAVLTILPGAVKAQKQSCNAEPKVTEIGFQEMPCDITFLERRPSPSTGSGLLKAEVVVSGGRGIEEEENFELIENLARLFPRSATGASRPICDYKWVSYAKQVGATGTIVAPKLYIACGISGATQHLEGMRESQFIVAVNSDPEAPIFQIADICIVEDLTEFIPILIEAIENKKM